MGCGVGVGLREHKRVQAQTLARKVGASMPAFQIVRTFPTGVPTKGRLRKMKKKLLHLQHMREQGTPDRFREEDLLRALNNTPNVPEDFWQKGGYPWAG